MYIEPTKTELLNFYISGADLKQYTYTLRVYESICKPYITAQAILVDNNNIVENLNIKGGELATFRFTSYPNSRVYQQTLSILSITGKQNPNNIKSIIYTFELIGPIYFQDRESLVQEGFIHQTGTQAIQKIFGKYLSKDTLSVLEQSQGMLGDQEGYTVSNMKPFAAIDDIRKYLLFGGRTGNSLFFRDRDNVKLASLEFLFANMGSQEYYEQRETWAAVFNEPLIYHAIIAAHIEAGRYNVGRAGGGESQAMEKQGKAVFDMFEGIMQVADYIKGGAAPNQQIANSYRNPRATAPDQKTMSEVRFSSKVRSGHQLLVKVPMQTGINSTIGKGITVTLMPPSGDDLNANPYNYSFSGAWLVTDICHELQTDGKQMAGTTTLQCLRPLS